MKMMMTLKERKGLATRKIWSMRRMVMNVTRSSFAFEFGVFSFEFGVFSFEFGTQRDGKMAPWRWALSSSLLASSRLAPFQTKVD
ncbi:hypothetical protein YC2023_118728 [Brassica napus]